MGTWVSSIKIDPDRIYKPFKQWQTATTKTQDFQSDMEMQKDRCLLATLGIGDPYFF